MAVSVGGLVEDTDYTGLVTRTLAILGNGTGQSGYGQRCYSAENWIGVSAGDQIGIAEWNSLRTDINKCRNHQADADALSSSQAAGNIVGADATGTTVTRISGDTFSIDSPDTALGVNDWFSAVGTIETNAGAVHSSHYSLTTTRAFLNSTRTTSWGGAGAGQTIYAELQVIFDGGYNTTDSSGTSVVATGADHRRHFFNAGGEIRLSMTLSGSTPKDTDWGTMLGNAGYIVFGKNSTTCTGTGRARDGSTDVDNNGSIESAFGNFQLGTGYQLIFRKNGSQAEYAENEVSIYAKRSSASDSITFMFEFTDYDAGDKTGTGPAVDEPVLQLGGSMVCGIDLLRPSGSFVSITEPSSNVVTELRLT